MNRDLLKDSIGWGFLLWFAGYLLGIVLFVVVPASAIGWVIMPIGITLTVWVLMTRVHVRLPVDFLILAIIWTTMAVGLDYFMIVKAFNPPDGYYKLDVYLYYAFTFVLPLLAGWRRQRVPHVIV